MNEGSLQLDPEYSSIQDEIDLLREELTSLLTAEHDLLHVIKPNLLALYQQKIGTWELQCLHAQLEAGRARRRLEMARAAVNQGKQPDWTEIEGQLELEFLAWQQRLREATQRLSEAERRLKHFLSPAEDREIKKIYYALVKKLHPDVNPHRDENRRRLWQRVQDAYECGDVEELRALALLANQADTTTILAPDAIQAMRRHRDALQRQIVEMERRIDEIESLPPFPLCDQLADEAWVHARRTEIEASSARFTEQRAASEAALQILVHSLAHGQQPGSN